MKRAVYMFFLMLAALSALAGDGRKTVLLLGDSIRMGYAPHVRELLKERAKVVYPEGNCMFAYYTLRMVWEWTKLVDDPKSVDVVHFNNGLWDLGQRDGRDCLTPVDVYASTLRRIAKELRHFFPKARIVFATTTPINEKVFCEQHSKGNAEVERYNAAAMVALAGEVDAINDMYSFVRKNNVGCHYEDIVHFKEEGYRMLAGQVVKSISEAMDASDGISPRIVCECAGPWTFSQAMVPCGEGVWEFCVEAKSPEPAVPPKFRVEFSVPQDGGHHVWTANPSRAGHAGVRVDWEKPYRSNLAKSLPLACAKNCSDRNNLTVASSEALRDVSYAIRLREEECAMKVDFEFFSTPEAKRTAYSTAIRIDRRNVFWGDAVRDAADWIRRENGYRSAPVPAVAFAPLYSTWYQFHQNVTAGKIEQEAKIAASLGMKTLIVDDGWQTDDSSRGYSYCGDWEVSERSFPDMAAHVKRVQAAGLKYMMWYSVPFIGENSRNFERFKGKYLYHDERQGAAVLDPRFPEVREFLASLYERAQKEWGIDGFKLDFIDSFSVKDGDPAAAEGYAGRDILTVPDAVDALLGEIVARLRANDPDVLIEFRQNYIGPAVTKYGNMLRAADCPGDRQANRVRIADLRLTSGKAAVHADMLEWNVATSAEEAAGSVISAIFGTVQYSMMLSDLPEAHLKMIAHWVRFAEAHCEALQKGAFSGFSPEAGYPILCGESEEKRIIGVYGNDRVVRIGDMEKITFVLNGSGVPSVCVELPEKARFEVRDTFGATVCSGEAGAGISRMSVPLGGYAIFRSGR